MHIESDLSRAVVGPTMCQPGLKMMLFRRSLGGRLQGHRVAQAFEAVDKPTFHGPAVALIEVAMPKVVVVGAVAQ